jgi:hypothetical protein
MDRWDTRFLLGQPPPASVWPLDTTTRTMRIITASLSSITDKPLAA